MTFRSADGATNLTDPDLVRLTAAQLAAATGGGTTEPPPPALWKYARPSATHTSQFAWLADRCDPKVLPDLKTRNVPYHCFFGTKGRIADPLDGKTMPKRIRSLPIMGLKGGLYSQQPDDDANGISRPLYQQYGDDLPTIVSMMAKVPQRFGKRAVNAISAYCSWLWHPTLYPDNWPDASLRGTPIPRGPLATPLGHDGKLFAVFPDGSAKLIGQVPGITQSYHADVNPTDRTKIAVADYGNKCIAIIDRTPAIKVSPQNEDTNLYIVGRLYPCIAPTSVRYAPDGTLYHVDNMYDRVMRKYLAPSMAYKNGVLLAIVPGLFAISHDPVLDVLRGVCDDGSVVSIDCKTGTVTPLFAATGKSNLTVDFFTIEVDTAGTCLPQGWFWMSRVHTGGNKELWLFKADGSLYGKHYFGGMGPPLESAKGRATIGDVRNVEEWLHYAWGAVPSPWHALTAFLGYGSTTGPCFLAFFATAGEGGALEETNYNYLYQERGKDVLRKGGPDAAPYTRPSLLAWWTEECWGWYITADEIADWSLQDGSPDFQGFVDFIHAGMFGSYRRDDIVGVDLYSVGIHIYRSSQRYLLEGAVLMGSWATWFAKTYGSIPAAPSYGASAFHFPAVQDTDTLLEAYESSPGVYSARVMRTYQADVSAQAVPAGAIVIADDQTADRKVTQPFASGPHSLTVSAPGWATRAVLVVTP